MSDSDGGAPLHHLVVATAFFTSLAHDPGSDPDSDGAEAQDSYGDSDGDDAYDAPHSGGSTHHSSPLAPLFSLTLHSSLAASALDMDDLFPAAPWADNPPTPLGAGGVPHPTQPVPAHFLGDLADAFPPLQLSNPNPAILGSENLGLVDFLRDWAHRDCFASPARPRPLRLDQVYRQASAPVPDMTYADLRGDECDLQGLDWAAMQTTRRDARVRRRHTYKNYVNRPGSDKCVSLVAAAPRLPVPAARRRRAR